MGVQIPRHRVGKADDGVLGQVVEEVAAVPERVAVGHLDDESGVAHDHQRRPVPAGDDVAVDGPLEQRLSLGGGKGPEGRSPLGQRVAAPDVIDQHVQPTLFGADALEQPFDFRLHGVVRPDGDAAAALRGDHLRRLLDRLGSPGGGGFAPHAPSRAVDRGARRTQHAGDAAPRAARGAGNDGHLAVQRLRLVRHGSPLGVRQNHLVRLGDSAVPRARRASRMSRTSCSTSRSSMNGERMKLFRPTIGSP